MNSRHGREKEEPQEDREGKRKPARAG